jgi:hypothetical protein
MLSLGVTFIASLMPPSQKMKRTECGRQWNNVLIIPIDIAPLLKQYVRPSHNVAIKTGTQDQIPEII